MKVLSYLLFYYDSYLFRYLFTALRQVLSNTFNSKNNLKNAVEIDLKKEMILEVGELNRRRRRDSGNLV